MSLPGYCTEEGCDRPAGRTGRCETCLSIERDREKKANRPKKEVAYLQRGTTPIKKVSDKRKEENKEYALLRDAYLKEHTICECCGSTPSDCIHHRKGRQNSLLCEVQYFMAVCDSCHVAIHADPNWSFDNGYMLLRSKQEIIDNPTI